MLLTQTAIYGLRAMAILAVLQPGESLNVKDLAERTGVPQQYLSKVMRKLVLARVVRSQRGRGGGFQLAQPPRKIRLADVLAATDVDLSRGCAFGFTACDPQNPCPLHPLWSRLQDSLGQWCADSTLADLGPPPKAPQRR